MALSVVGPVHTQVGKRKWLACIVFNAEYTQAFDLSYGRHGPQRKIIFRNQPHPPDKIDQA